MSAQDLPKGDEGIGRFYERCAVERRAVVRAFAEVRRRAGDFPSGERVLRLMQEVEDEAGGTGD